MSLTETFALLAVIISLLSLIFTVLFGAFDIAWKIAERQNKNGQKKTASKSTKPRRLFF